jgi:hypothetical protein
MDTIPNENRESFGQVTIQGVAEAIKVSGRHNDWIAELHRKYEQ